MGVCCVHVRIQVNIAYKGGAKSKRFCVCPPCPYTSKHGLQRRCKVNEVVWVRRVHIMVNMAYNAAKLALYCLPPAESGQKSSSFCF